jgi:hypothetical protein
MDFRSHMRACTGSRSEAAAIGRPNPPPIGDSPPEECSERNTHLVPRGTALPRSKFETQPARKTALWEERPMYSALEVEARLTDLAREVTAWQRVREAHDQPMERSLAQEPHRRGSVRMPAWLSAVGGFLGLV